MPDDFDLRPVQDDEGLWNALYGDGYGHVLGYETEELCQAWIDGYEAGGRDNF